MMVYMWQPEEILILVKVYPTPSSKYGETVCTAGLTKDGNWIRVYPVPYRTLKIEQQFQKFQWIQANIQKASEKLQRPESYKIDADSIELLRQVKAGKTGWTYFFKQREAYFVVGTDSQFGNFMILTVISPRRLEDQLSLGI